MDARRPVLFFSLEMSHLELTQRLLCSEAQVSTQNIRSGRLSDNDWKRVNAAVGHLAEAPLWIDDNPNTSVLEIRAKARRKHAEWGDLGPGGRRLPAVDGRSGRRREHVRWRSAR